MMRRSFHRSTAFSAICGAALFAAAAALLSIRAAGLRRTFDATSGGGAAHPEASFLPDGRHAGDWIPAGPRSTYTPKDLFELINGGADLVVEYGFQKLIRAEYRKVSDPKTSLAVEIYDMGTPEGAFGIYGFERGDRPSNETLGDEGIVSTASIAFRRGRYYVKMETSNLSGQAVRAARPLAERIASLIPGPPGRIEDVERLPREGLVPGTARLILHGPMGFASLPRTFLADYESLGRKYTLFFCTFESPERAKAGLEDLRKEAEARWTIEYAADILRGRARDGNHLLLARRHGRRLAGVNGDIDEPEALKKMDDLLAELGR